MHEVITCMKAWRTRYGRAAFSADQKFTSSKLKVYLTSRSPPSSGSARPGQRGTSKKLNVGERRPCGVLFFYAGMRARLSFPAVQCAFVIFAISCIAAGQPHSVQSRLRWASEHEALPVGPRWIAKANQPRVPRVLLRLVGGGNGEHRKKPYAGRHQKG